MSQGVHSLVVWARFRKLEAKMKIAGQVSVGLHVWLIPSTLPMTGSAG
jgi:hypothetical protein